MQVPALPVNIYYACILASGDAVHNWNESNWRLRSTFDAREYVKAMSGFGVVAQW